METASDFKNSNKCGKILTSCSLAGMLLPGVLSSPPSFSTPVAVCQHMILTFTFSTAFLASSSPMGGALPFRLKYIEGWKPQHVISIDFLALLIRSYTSPKAFSPLTSGLNVDSDIGYCAVLPCRKTEDDNWTRLSFSHNGAVNF